MDCPILRNVAEFVAAYIILGAAAKRTCSWVRIAFAGIMCYILRTRYF